MGDRFLTLSLLKQVANVTDLQDHGQRPLR
jgi:hypothetical protein